MINQFGASEGDKYQVTMNLSEYKFWRRLKSLTRSCELHVYLDDKGNIKSLRVLDLKEERLDLE